MTAASPPTDASVRAASSPLLTPGTQAAPLVDVLGVNALLYVQWDAAERHRRERTGAGALDRMSDLNVLQGLPAGCPIPLAAMSRSERLAVRRLPRGAVQQVGENVVRLAVRPLRLDLAVVRATGWRRGLEAAGRFAPFGRRALLLDRRPRDADEMMLEAAFYGIGILIKDEDGLELAVAPREYRPARHTVAAWRFEEMLYRRLIAAA